MTITATFVSATKEDSQWAVVISYGNGAKTLLKSYNVKSVDDATIKALAKAEVALLKRVSDSVGLVKLVPGSLIDLTDESAPLPTAAEIAESQWRTDHSKLLRASEFVSLGIISATNPAYVELSSKVKARFLPEYL